MGFNLKKAPVTVLLAESTCKMEDSEPDSDQEPTGTGDSQATSVQYVQQCQKAVETSQASKNTAPV